MTQIMDSVTLRSRLLKLLQKSRKASRLYGTVTTSSDIVSFESNEPKEMQAKEWKSVTSELLQELSSTLENPNPKRLLQQSFSIRDRFYSDYRMCESELNRSQIELVNCAEVADYARALVLSKNLIKLKAKTQALHAAYHELAEILSRSKNPIDDLPLTENLNNTQLEFDANDFEQTGSSKVIPLRQKRVVSAY